jgi:predicted TIM-barrel fold metal-dependent hydrolase
MIDGLRVIDAHQHVGDVSMSIPQSVEQTDELSEDERIADELARRLARMDLWGIDEAVIIASPSYLRPNGASDTRRVNDDVAAYRDRMPTRLRAAVGVAEPLHGAASIAEVERIATELDMVGVSFHARFQGCATDSPLILKIIQRVGEMGMVPFVHAIGEVADEGIYRIATLGRAFPDLPIVVLDAFSTNEQAIQATAIADFVPNLVFDISLAVHTGQITGFIRRFGADRVLFGTDLYSHPFDLTPDQKTAIFAGNIQQILKLEG